MRFAIRLAEMKPGNRYIVRSVDDVGIDLGHAPDGPYPTIGITHVLQVLEVVITN